MTGHFRDYYTLLELQAKQQCLPMVLNNQAWLNKDGFVWLHNTKKIPILGSNNKVSIILTLTDDITSSMSLLELYDLYTKFYINKVNRVKKFLLHMKIYSFFIDIPTDAETKVLIYKKITNNNKSIANLLKISLKTVETHIYNLRSKVINLDLVLSKM